MSEYTEALNILAQYNISTKDKVHLVHKDEDGKYHHDCDPAFILGIE